MESLIQSCVEWWIRISLACWPPERCVRRSGKKYNSECISTTVGGSMEEELSWCGGAFQLLGLVKLLHCEKSINALEYRIILQKGLLPKIEKLFSKVEQSDVIFQQCSCPHCKDQPKCGLRTSPSGSCFGPVRVQTWTRKRIFGLTLNTN